MGISRLIWNTANFNTLVHFSFHLRKNSKDSWQVDLRKAAKNSTVIESILCKLIGTTTTYFSLFFSFFFFIYRPSFRSPFLSFFRPPCFLPPFLSLHSCLRSLSPFASPVQRSSRYDAAEKYCLLVELSIRV